MSDNTVYAIIGVPALLEQTAEECSELAHACLKAARKMRNENPTPKSVDDILAELTEEIADVQLCIDEVMKTGLISYEGVDSEILRKRERMEGRLNEFVKENQNCGL